MAQAKKRRAYSKNRHLFNCTPEPDRRGKVLIATQIANLPNGVRSDRANQAIGSPIATQKEAAAIIGTTAEAISQARAMIEQIANMKSGERTDLKPSEMSQKVSQEAAAAQLSTTPKAITQARTIKEWAPELRRRAEDCRYSLCRTLGGRGRRFLASSRNFVTRKC